MGDTQTSNTRWDADLFDKRRTVTDVERPERFVLWDRIESNRKNKMFQNQFAHVFKLQDRTKPIAKPGGRDAYYELGRPPRFTRTLPCRGEDSRHIHSTQGKYDSHTF